MLRGVPQRRDVEKEARCFPRCFEHFKFTVGKALFAPEGGFLAGGFQKTVHFPVSIKRRGFSRKPDEINKGIERVVFPVAFDERFQNRVLHD